uniref:Uncharacterized protein n=1 Tax=Candidatus Kentrum sp. SD TaxID=2126332 RepID=A0A451BJL2_9GAMM|nr:MAG: hypothetical protein BECKSD772F_GA0070984_12665 [Candidatus Kentron sp. SD]VFK78477.1 MAG: hypothetical protein BECKSD772D_GA0070982_101551 [Candidatus Kentron sp. SD]
MKIARITPQQGGFLTIVAEDRRRGGFDARPYMKSRLARLRPRPTRHDPALLNHP